MVKNPCFGAIHNCQLMTACRQRRKKLVSSVDILKTGFAFQLQRKMKKVKNLLTQRECVCMCVCVCVMREKRNSETFGPHISKFSLETKTMFE